MENRKLKTRHNKKTETILRAVDDAYTRGECTLSARKEYQLYRREKAQRPATSNILPQPFLCDFFTPEQKKQCNLEIKERNRPSNSSVVTVERSPSR